MDLQLDEKKILVTGASRGLGFATARCLAQEGARVVINGRSETKLREAVSTLKDESGGDVRGFSGDVTDKHFPEKLVAQAAEVLGGVDILITNAGGPPPGSFESFDEATWEQAIELSFMSHVRLIRAALPHLRKSPAASVLTITSYSVRQPVPNLVLSNSIRAATVGLTKSLAWELGSDGIRFNSILPGWTETERVKELMQQRAEIKGTSVEEEVELQASNTPLGRMGTPKEFANAAAFLVSPAAAYINGVMLLVDGGAYRGTV